MSLRDKKDNPDLRIWLNTKHKECNLCALPLKLKPQRAYGNLDADIIFMGESPGPEIDQDHNYAWACGRTSLYFKAMLEKYGFNRNDVYFTNLVKCYNPGTSKRQIINCMYLLELELKIIQPKVIVCASSIAWNNLPRWMDEVKNAKIIKIWHPAYVKRFNLEAEYELQWKKVKETYEGVK